jgi:hypothetical protein
MANMNLSLLIWKYDGSNSLITSVVELMSYLLRRVIQALKNTLTSKITKMMETNPPATVL